MMGASSPSSASAPVRPATWAPQRLDHSPALDGLRGVAVLLVVVAHGSHGHVPGAAYGVEIFFVLSGFLITSLLINEWHADGQISLSAFYVRRAGRLLPALLATLVLCCVLYALDGHVNAYTPLPSVSNFAESAAGTLFYYNNWLEAFTPDPLSLLGHTWSLAIEEQFYIVWPPLLLVLLRRGVVPSRLLFGVLVAATLSWILRIALWVHGSHSAVYYRSDTRAVAPLLGSALAIGMASPAWRHKFARVTGTRTIAWLSAALLAGVAFTLPQTAFAGMIFGLTVGSLCTAAIIGSIMTCQSAFERLLALRPLRYFGERSYGLYLYHYPLFTFISSSRIPIGKVQETVIRFALTIAIAEISYRVLERPARKAVRMHLARAHMTARIQAVT